MNLYLDAGILSALRRAAGVSLQYVAGTRQAGSPALLVPRLRSGIRIGISATLATIGAGLCVATERFHAGFVGGVGELGEGIVGGHPLQGLGLPDALGLTLAADVGVVLVSVVGVVVVRTVLARARHRRLLNLLAAPSLSRAGTLTLDHPSPVAYCLPGIRPRIVISSGTQRLLDQAQLAAVIEHERGHAHERHGLVMLPMTSLTEPFRWIPYARLAPRAVAGLLEMAADDHAARRHAPSSSGVRTRGPVHLRCSSPLCLRRRLTRRQCSGAPTPRPRPDLKDCGGGIHAPLHGGCGRPTRRAPIFVGASCSTARLTRDQLGGIHTATRCNE